MSLDLVKQVLRLHEELRAARRKEEPTWRELAQLLRPDDQDFDPRDDRRREDIELYDSTPLYALDNFVGGMYGQLINPANRWFELGVEQDPELSKWGPVKAYLYSLANVLYSSLSPAVSGFYSRAPAWIANVGAFGFGSLYQEEWQGRRRFIDQVIPVGETYLCRDAAGEYDTVHREWRWKGRIIADYWGDRAPPGLREDAEYVIVHAVRPNPGYIPGRLGAAGMPFASVYCSPDLKDWSVVGGYYELPYHIVPWNERARSAYPTGPGHNQRPDSLTLQEIERSRLIAEQFDAEPPILGLDDDVLSAADIRPGAYLRGTLNSQGKQLLQRLERGARPQSSLDTAERRRNNIRSAFYYGIMQLIDRPQMTATEFLGFQEETLKLMAPNLVKVQTGGLSPFIARRFRLLQRAGQLPPPPPELQGRALEPQYISPLAKVQKLSDGRAAMQLVGAVQQIAQSNPEVVDKLNADRVVDVVGDAFTSIPGLVRDDDAVQQIRQNRAAMQQQQMQLEQAAMAASIHADVSHADQAATLAQRRQAAPR